MRSRFSLSTLFILMTALTVVTAFYVAVRVNDIVYSDVLPDGTPFYTFQRAPKEQEILWRLIYAWPLTILMTLTASYGLRRMKQWLGAKNSGCQI